MFFRPVARSDSRHKPLPVSSSLLGEKLQREREGRRGRESERKRERETGREEGREGGGEVINEALSQDPGPEAILQFQMLSDFILLLSTEPSVFLPVKSK